MLSRLKKIESSILSDLLCLFIIANFVGGCASFERNIGFKRFFTKKNQEQYFHEIELKDDQSLTVVAYPQNSSKGVYFAGPLLPILPVFWWPEYKFSLDDNEMLQVSCNIYYSPGRNYLDKRKDGYYNTSKKGMELIDHRRLQDQDLCIEVTIILENGEEISPVTTETVHGKGQATIFTFAVLAREISSYTLRVKKIATLEQERISLENVSYTFRRFDRKEFKFFSPM